MPSIVHESPGMVASGLALVSQQVQEQSNGLVVVALKFTAPASREAQVRPLFAYDAPPPVTPSAINRNLLQEGRVFLGDASFEITNGLLHIAATYYGAAFAAQRSPYITRSYESRTLALSFPSGTIVVSSTTTENNTPITRTRLVFDTFVVRYVVEKLAAEYATTENAFVDYGFKAEIVRATFISRNLTNGDPGNLNLSHRTKSALEFAQERAFAPIEERRIQSVTRRVEVHSIIYDLEETS
jgi:hypothetical protein